MTKPKIVLISQARTGSRRLPGKVLKKINGKTLLEIHIERVLCSKLVNIFCLATTAKKEDNAIVEIGKKCNYEVYRGLEQDVLDRYYCAAKLLNADIVVRVTSDCPLIDSILIDDVIAFALEKQVDYCSNTTLKSTFPNGQDVEVMKFSALALAWNEAVLREDREHVTPYICNNSNFRGMKKFIVQNYIHEKNYSNIRMTVDEMKDFELIKILIDRLGCDKRWYEYAGYIINHPEIFEISSYS